MAAIVGAAGLASCLAAARAGKRLLLANKEALVVGGDVFLRAVRDGGATLLDPTADLVISKTGPSPALGVIGVPFNWLVVADETNNV